MKGVERKKELSPEQREELLKALKARFEKNMNRHKGLEWATVKAKLEAGAEKLWSLNEMERAGLKVNFKKDPEPIPEELQKKLDEIPALKTAFEALTPGRQRGYVLYFSGAKQSKTRESRVEKWLPQILKGKGLND